jgi:hypothetical protein
MILRPSYSIGCAKVWAFVFVVCRLSSNQQQQPSYVCDGFLTTTITSLAPPCQQQQQQQQQYPYSRLLVLSSSTSPQEENDERQKLLDKAKQLRDEALTLEQQVTKSRPTPYTSSSPPLAAVTNLNDSTWTISYRFSSQPKDENDDAVIPNYSGKMTVFLKGDGYSELKSTSDGAKITVAKIWGWDEENSQEDGQQYLLFSMDILLPDSDPTLPGAKQRYYFQARVEKDSRGAISLTEGTITVKKDVSEKTKGMWGLFQVAGILSQFRYVGDFIAKPS